jgi:hypothetical protein
MKCKVVLAARPILSDEELLAQVGFIPGTDWVLELDTTNGMGADIWNGYLEMRESQKTSPPPTPWAKIKVADDNNPEHEINRFEEAINIVMRFCAGEGRDNCLAVKSITRL